MGSSQTTGETTYSFGTSPSDPGYQYHLDGSLLSVKYPSERVVNYAYDHAGRVTSSASGGTSYTSGYSYAPHGAVSSVTLGNGLTETMSFNNRLQPCQLSAGSLMSLSFRYRSSDMGCEDGSGNNGNIWFQDISYPHLGFNETQAYGYDGVNRLTAVNAVNTGTWQRSYDYDAFGNRAATGDGITFRVRGRVRGQPPNSGSGTAP